MLTDLHEKPGQLRDILVALAAPSLRGKPGSNPITDMLSSPMAKAVLAGIAAVVVKNMMGSSKKGVRPLRKAGVRRPRPFSGTHPISNPILTFDFRDLHGLECPLWVISGPSTRSSECPLSATNRRGGGKSGASHFQIERSFMIAS